MPRQGALTGKIIEGHYRIEEMIGRGGMADVYRAYDERLDRDVAVKVMHRQLAESDPSFMARFEREAKSAANMSSPNVVAIYDYGQFEGWAYMVMELLNGQDLKTIIKNNKHLPLDYTARIGAQICNALACAHAKGIVHRDVKPQNIMIVDNGMVKLMDFGIARPKTSSLTVQDQVLGTAYYISPEQAKGEPLDGKSDQYSLGCVLYECATGSVPFDGDEPVTVAMKQVTEQPRPMSELVPGIDPQFEMIVMKCMSKNPADRFENATELGTVLSDYAAGRRVDIGYDLSNAETVLMTPDIEYQQTSVMPTNLQGAASQQKTFEQHNSDDEDEKASDEAKARKKKIIIGSVAAAVIVIIAIVGCVLAFGNQTEPEPEPEPTPEIVMVDVPNFVGKTEEEARNMAEEANLEIKIRNEQSSTVPEGSVIRQSPAANEQVEEGSTIELVISSGEGSIAIPNVVGMTESDAYAKLASAGFAVGDVTKSPSDTVPAGTVISQGATGNAQRGTSVSLTVSSGPETVQIPYVVGMTLSEAYAALDGFNVRVSGSTDGSSIVVSQDTGRVAEGGEVNVTTQKQSNNTTNNSSNSTSQNNNNNASNTGQGNNANDNESDDEDSNATDSESA